MLRSALDVAEPIWSASSAQSASAAFDSATQALGTSYLQTRHYRRPRGILTNDRHWAAGGFVARRARRGWVGSSGFHYICFEQNPLLQPIREGRTRYRFSDYAPHSSKAFGGYWEALSGADIADALCATAYGPDGAIASLHLGLPTRDIDPTLRDVLWLAGGILVERMMYFELAPREEPTALLSPRERDAMRYVCEGKTDWEIGTILGVAESTARFHVDNARRKLRAVNRAHAVARFLAHYGVD
jgi:LuxR family quorum sensing-dependent transcriptional regulator